MNHFCGGFVLDLYGINKTLFYISPGYTCSSMLFTKAFSFLFLTKKNYLFHLLGFVKVKILIMFYIKLLIKIKTYRNHFHRGIIQDFLYRANKRVSISPGCVCMNIPFMKAFSFIFLLKTTFSLYLLGSIKVEILIIC